MESHISKEHDFTPCLLIFTVLSIKKFILGYYRENFVKVCCNIFTDCLMPEAGNYDGEGLTGHICCSSLLTTLFA